MFRAYLRPSSGGQTAFSMPVVFCPVVTVVTVVTVVMLESRLADCVHCVEKGNLLHLYSLIVASSWSRLYLLIKDARSFEYKVQYCILDFTVIKFIAISLAKNAALAKTKFLSETTRREVMWYT